MRIPGSTPVAALTLAVSLLIQGAAAGTRGSEGRVNDGTERTIARRFSVERQPEGWWLVAPGGRRFFSLGVCCVNPGVPRTEFDPETPAYAAWQHYGTTQEWADATLRRLASWGFTTAGAWSDGAALSQSREHKLWLTPVLHLGSSAGAPWWDMWSSKVIRRMEETARDQILAVRDDPHLLGYYTDNELGWWNATLFKMTLEQPSDSGQRRRLLDLLRETYHQDWGELLRDFDAENAGSWSELGKGGMLYLKPGGQGIKLLRRFLGILADRYYQLAHQIVRKYDQRALILGDRYQSFFYPDVARASAAYVDVVSSNLNPAWNDGTFLRSYLDALHQLTGKPILISECYMAAMENRSGNRNSQGGFPVVATQAERAEGFRRTLTSLLRLPYVVGVDWFQYSDEPTHGREDGENFNFGLVDIHDQPYAELTSVPVSLDPIRLKTQAPTPRADASGGIPPAPSDPMGDFEPTHALKHWDRERGFVKPVSDLPMADLYLCWTPQALFLGVYALDIIEDAYYRSRSVPKKDRPLWTVRVQGGESVQARLGAGREPIVSDPGVRVQNLSGLNLNVQNVAVMELPARRFGKQSLQAGDTIELSTSLLSHCQASRVDWEGKFQLRN